MAITAPMHARPYRVERALGGHVIRKPDGILYNGVWRAERIARLACDSLNRRDQVAKGYKPDLLLSDTGVTL